MADFDAMHEHFKRGLEESHESVQKVVEYIRSRGYKAWANEVEAAPTIYERKAYKDDGDVTFVHPELGEQIVEVHRLSVDFTEKRWPFGRHFIVDRKDSIDEKKRDPLVYAILNKTMTVCAFVHVPNTRQHWYVEKRTNGPNSEALGEPVVTDYYLVDISRVSFRPI